MIFFSDLSSSSATPPSFKYRSSFYKIMSVEKKKNIRVTSSHHHKGCLYQIKLFMMVPCFSSSLTRRAAFSPGFYAFFWVEINVEKDSIKRTKNRSPRKNSTVARMLFDLVIVTKRVSAGQVRSWARSERLPEERCA